MKQVTYFVGKVMELARLLQHPFRVGGCVEEEFLGTLNPGPLGVFPTHTPNSSLTNEWMKAWTLVFVTLGMQMSVQLLALVLLVIFHTRLGSAG